MFRTHQRGGDRHDERSGTEFSKHFVFQTVVAVSEGAPSLKR